MISKQKAFLELHFGALVPKISEQLKESTIDRKDLKRFDGHADAITRLYICGLLTGSETRNARQRLTNLLAKKIVPKGAK
jgi:hypothetical protein